MMHKCILVTDDKFVMLKCIGHFMGAYNFQYDVQSKSLIVDVPKDQMPLFKEEMDFFEVRFEVMGVEGVYIVHDIVWDVDQPDDEEDDLSEAAMQAVIDKLPKFIYFQGVPDDMADILSDKYGWTIKSLKYTPVN